MKNQILLVRIADYTRILFAIKLVISRTEKVMGNVSIYSAILGRLPPKTV